MKFGNGVRDTVLDAQVTSCLQDFEAVEYRQNVSRVIESNVIVNVLNLLGKVILRKKMVVNFARNF